MYVLRQTIVKLLKDQLLLLMMTTVNNDDFKLVMVTLIRAVMDKRLNKFKSSIISQLTEDMKILTQSEFKNIIQDLKIPQQQHMTNLKK